MKKKATANVVPIRQTTQYNCMSCSMAMALQANGIPPEEATIELVNRVMGAQPMQGASWENAIACAQHYGMRVHLICPATLRQVKEFTDRGSPVMIAWNPEGRDWSHASVIFDVDDDLTVSVADPNIPDPDETVRIVPKDDFYHKWFEKWPNYLVRRTAMAVEREITPEGRQMAASFSQPLMTRYDYGLQDKEQELTARVATRYLKSETERPAIWLDNWRIFVNKAFVTKICQNSNYQFTRLPGDNFVWVHPMVDTDPNLNGGNDYDFHFHPENSGWRAITFNMHHRDLFLKEATRLGAAVIKKAFPQNNMHYIFGNRR